MLTGVVVGTHQEEDRVRQAARSLGPEHVADRHRDGVRAPHQDHLRPVEAGQPQVRQRHATGDRRRADTGALEEPLRQRLGRARKPLGQLRRRLGDDLLEGVALPGHDHGGPGHDLFVGIPVAKTFFLENAPQLAVEAGVPAAAESLEHVVHRPVPVNAFAPVGAVPQNGGEHEAEREQDRQPSHLRDDPERSEYAGDLHPRVQRRSEAGVVRLQPALAHDDHGQAQQAEHEKLQAAGELGDPGRVPQDHQEEKNRHDGEDDGHVRRAPLVELPEDRRNQVVTGHRQRVTAGSEDPGVGHGGERQHRGQRHGPDAEGAGDLLRRHLDGCEALGKLLYADDAHHHADAEHVHDHRGPQGEKYPQRQVALRVLHFLGDARDVGHPDVADEHEPGGGDDRIEPLVEEPLEMQRIEVLPPEGDEHGEDRQQPEDQHLLEAAGLLRTQQVHDAEEHGEPRRDGVRPEPVQEFRRRRVMRADQVEDQEDVRPHADEGEGRFQHQRQPGSKPADRARQRTEAPIKKIVRAAGPGHGGGQLHDAQHRRHDQHGRDHIAQDDRRPRLPGGEPRKQEEAGAERGPGRYREHAEQRQLFPETAGLLKNAHRVTMTISRRNPRHGPPSTAAGGA